MKIDLLHYTPLWVCAKAIRKCWASEGKSDSYIRTNTYDTSIECGDKDKELINRVGNKNKHKSTLEHLVYSFDIDGISRACLQELARHRIASYSVKSTRYTLKELKNDLGDLSKYLVSTNDEQADMINVMTLEALRSQLSQGLTNDIAKFMLPEAYKTSLVMTINARSLQNFLELRTSKSALWEIRELANNMFNALPHDHVYLFEDFINEVHTDSGE